MMTSHISEMRIAANRWYVNNTTRWCQWLTSIAVFALSSEEDLVVVGIGEIVVGRGDACSRCVGSGRTLRVEPVNIWSQGRMTLSIQAIVTARSGSSWISAQRSVRRDSTRASMTLEKAFSANRIHPIRRTDSPSFMNLFIAAWSSGSSIPETCSSSDSSSSDSSPSSSSSPSPWSSSSPLILPLVSDFRSDLLSLCSFWYCRNLMLARAIVPMSNPFGIEVKNAASTRCQNSLMRSEFVTAEGLAAEALFTGV
mmetsp:Transcript_25863/g.62295  ORF Transcript_25863/g.62295 Transcript_25863/m.62295 type:complete len:254 (+) Transcript_25863:1851-2612(+)